MYVTKPATIRTTEPKLTMLMLFQPKKWLRMMRIAPMMKIANPAILILLSIIVYIF